jgi:predicted nucleic acid-binding Zn finger protein
MVNVLTVKGLVDRYAKAEALIEAGAVVPAAGLAGYAVVRNGDGTQMYLVRFEAEHQNCTCPDFQERQKDADLPCKHLIAAELAATRAAKPARTISGREALAILNDEEAA